MKLAVIVLLAVSLSAFAAEKPKPTPTQPATEALDLAAIARIRDEGLLPHPELQEQHTRALEGIYLSKM